MFNKSRFFLDLFIYNTSNTLPKTYYASVGPKNASKRFFSILWTLLYNIFKKPNFKVAVISRLIMNFAQTLQVTVHQLAF